MRAEGKSNSILPSNGPVCSSTKWAFMKPDWRLNRSQIPAWSWADLSNNQIHAPSHYFNQEKSVQFADCFLQGLWTRGLLNCSLRDAETPLLILDSFHKAPKPRNLPLQPPRCSYFNIVLCVSVWVYLSDSAFLHFMKGVSQQPSNPSTHLSSTLPPSPLPLPSSLSAVQLTWTRASVKSSLMASSSL